MKKKSKVKEFDWIVMYAMFSDPAKSVTVKDVQKQYSWTHGKAQRCLDRLASAGYIKRRSASFWNGMHYATRFYYW